MGDIAASVLVRLNKLAKTTGRSHQICLQLFCQEEFLRRVEHSAYAENLILKGGLFLYCVTNFDSRLTVDVDFLMRRLPNNIEQLKMILNEILAVDTGNSFIVFELKKIEAITLHKKYPGVTASILARIKNTRTMFSIDFGVGDVIFPGAEKRSVPTQLDDFSAPVINTYSVETTIAEKLDAILDLMAFSSRMKDYYDIYYLANKFDFDGDNLSKALSKTFLNRQHVFELSRFEELLAFASDKGMCSKWSNFIKKIRSNELKFSNVLRTLEIFLIEPYKASITGENFYKHWNVSLQKWEYKKV